MLKLIVGLFLAQLQIVTYAFVFPADDVGTFNAMPSTQLNGPNYYIEYTAPGYDYCKKACVRQVSCKAFMVDKGNGQCYLYYGTYGTRPNSRFDSNVLVSRTAGCTEIWQTNTEKRGIIDGSVNVGWMPSRDECKNMCIQNSGCLSVDMIVFDDGHVNCFMQINKGNVDNPISIHTYVWDSCVPQFLQQTGSKYYPGPDGTCSVKFNHIANKQAAWGYKTPETTDYKNCLLRCAKTKICRGIDSIYSIRTQTVVSCIFHYDPMEVSALGVPEQQILMKRCP